MALAGIKKVAVIGAGVSGVCTAAHLLERDIEVVVFERTSVAAGVWHFDESAAADPSYPNVTPSKGDYDRIVDEDFAAGYLTPPRTPDEFETHTGLKGQPSSKSTTNLSKTAHAPPGACYASLKNNVPLSLMRNSLGDFPPGLEEFVSQSYLEEYIQGISRSKGVEEVTLYDTRVEDVQRVDNIWQICTTTRQQDDSGNARLIRRTWQFDAVVVASGHYHMPRIPAFPGLQEWKQRFPERVSHSKGYRRADDFKDQTILLIGAGTSSADIAKELATVAKHVYQSSRGGQFDFPASILPENASRIGGIQAFELDEIDSTEPLGHLPGKILLNNGQRLCNIDRVVICTGYVTSYPFLPQFHDDVGLVDDANEQVLVTEEGNMVHNLYKDIFYIEDPTLTFVGVPYHTATFSLFDFQAQLVARALAGAVVFPSRAGMREEYKERVRVKGRGRDFHSLRRNGHETAYVDELVAWANNDLNAASNIEPMRGHTAEWRTTYAAFKKMIEERIGLRLADSTNQPNKYDSILLTGSEVC